MRSCIGIGVGLWLVLASASAGLAADAGSAALLQTALAAQARGDEASAFPLLRRLAIAEDPEVQYRLGLLVEQPRSWLQPDPEEAAYWYRRAAEQGHTGAAKRLGDLHAAGKIGSFQSLGRQAPLLSEAVHWYWAAAAMGEEEAAAALRELAARSALVDALLERASGDHTAARSKLEPLAAGRDLEALHWRGVMQEMGEGGPPDPQGAVPWYEKAYQMGFGPATPGPGPALRVGEGRRARRRSGLPDVQRCRIAARLLG